MPFPTKKYAESYATSHIVTTAVPAKTKRWLQTQAKKNQLTLSAQTALLLEESRRMLDGRCGG